MNNEQKNIIENFTGILLNLNSVMAKVPESGLDWSEGEGEWSIRQIIHHLAEDCTVYGFILERALVTPGCKVFFGEFPGNEAWADGLGFGQRPISHALPLIHAQRAYFAELVNTFPERWENKVVFYNETGEKLAESTVREMLVMLTEHMQEHIDTLQRILAGNTPQK
jgi:hypothetical protein